MSVEKAVLAGGCFWGMEDLFRARPGVVRTRVGYTGGHLADPAYRDVTTGATGHAEALEIAFDNAKTDFRQMLEFFFRIHDPTTPERQGNDRGSQYRSAIFVLDDAQRAVAEDVIRAVDASGRWPGRVVTEIRPASVFYEAEAYHQKYLEKNPGGYTCHWVRPDWVV